MLLRNSSGRELRLPPEDLRGVLERQPGMPRIFNGDEIWPTVGDVDGVEDFVKDKKSHSVPCWKFNNKAEFEQAHNIGRSQKLPAHSL